MQHSYLHHIYLQNTYENPTGMENRTKIFIQRIDKIIYKNLDNEAFNVAFLANKVNLSVSQLNRKLKHITGQPAGKIIRNYRMKHAAHLIANDIASISEAAYQVGYMNHSHFCRSFKREYGCTPSQYSKKYITDYKLLSPK